MTQEEAFNAFWNAYPRRVGKGRARKAFVAAIRKTDLSTMIRALEAYKIHKPSYQDFCHPSTWLNDERWDDEWEAPAGQRNYMDVARSMMLERSH